MAGRERIDPVCVVRSRGCQDLHIAEDNVIGVIRYDLPHGRILCRDVLHPHVFAMVEHDESWPRVARLAMGPPTVSSPVDHTAARYHDVNRIFRRQKRSSRQFSKLLLLGEVVVITGCGEGCSGGDGQGDFASQSDRPADEGRCACYPDRSSRLCAIVDRRLNRSCIFRPAVASCAIGMNVADFLSASTCST